VREGRLVGWTGRGLEVAFSDRGTDAASAAESPLRFVAWRAVRPTSGRSLATVKGLQPGATVTDLRRIYPDVQFLRGEGGVIDTFRVSHAETSIWGLLDPARPGSPQPDDTVSALHSGTI
jgi:hypothetical protein